jgi:hypothetical protein
VNTYNGAKRRRVGKRRQVERSRCGCESPRRRACRPGVWWDIIGPRGVNHGAPWASPISPAEGTRGAIGSGGVIARTRSGRARAPVRGNGGNGLGSEGGDPTGSLTLSVS